MCLYLENKTLYNLAILIFKPFRLNGSHFALMVLNINMKLKEPDIEPKSLQVGKTWLPSEFRYIQVV